MLNRALLVALAVLWWPDGLCAQSPSPVAVGSRVRVTSETTGVQPLIGQVVAFEPGVLVVAAESGGVQQRVSLSRSTTLELSAGRKSRAAHGALIGVVAGAIPGLLMTFGDYNTERGSPAAVSLVGAASGAAIGSLIGLAIKSEDWLPAGVPAVTAGIVPVPRGASISVSLAWGRGSR